MDTAETMDPRAPFAAAASICALMEVMWETTGFPVSVSVFQISADASHDIEGMSMCAPFTKSFHHAEPTDDGYAYPQVDYPRSFIAWKNALLSPKNFMMVRSRRLLKIS